MQNKINNPATAILLGLSAALFLATQDVFIKLLAQDLNIFQIVFIRSIFAFLAAAAWVRFLSGGWQQLHIKRPRLVMIRIGCHIVSFFCYYVSLPFLPLPVYTTIGFTVFLFAAMLSGAFLKEPLTWREWLAAAAGMFGVILISNPGNSGEEINLYAVAMLLFGAFLWGVSLVITRALGASMTPGGIMFYSNLGLLVVGGISAPAVWLAPTSQAWLLLLCVGVLGFLAQNMLITAVQLSRVAVVTPTQYTSLLWASLYSWLLWDILPGEYVLFGAACIIGGGMLIITKKKT